MKILIIGASSYLGARLYFDLKSKFEVIGTYSSHQLSKEFIKLDLTDNIEIQNVINRIKPEIIIHCANLPKTEQIKSDLVKGKKINLESAEKIVEIANKINARIIYISSLSAVVQTDLYSEYKYQSEKLILNSKKGWLILQPPYILGMSPNTTNDRPFNRLLKNIFENVPAIYDTSWKTSSCYIKQISEVIEQCINKNIWNEIIPLGVEVKKSRYEFAQDILSNFNIKVEGVDKKDASASNKLDLTVLKKYKLPDYSYDEMIFKIVKEIKNKGSFSLDSRLPAFVKTSAGKARE
jgi:dTDP-4-dehydrorhamnose reductase